MARAFSEIGFTPTVRRLQERFGSARAYDKVLAPEAARGDRLGPREADFVRERDGFYQATVSSSGWPYVQFRGGPAGFLKVLDERTIAYADFRGNRQYLSAGNLTDNNRIAMILMDYRNRRRLKVFGRARLVDIADDPGLVARLHERAYAARPERAVIIAIEGLDWNCPQHIPRRLTMEEFARELAPVRDELRRLRAENEALKAERAGGPARS